MSITGFGIWSGTLFADEFDDNFVSRAFSLAWGRGPRARPTSHSATFDQVRSFTVSKSIVCLLLKLQVSRMFKTAVHMSCTLLTTKCCMLGIWLGFIETAYSKQFHAFARFSRTSKRRPRYKENKKKKLREKFPKGKVKKLFGFCHNSLALDKSGCIVSN